MKSIFHSRVQKRRGLQSGFTLVEVMVASALSMLVIAAAMSAFIQYRRTMVAQKNSANIQQNLRIGMTVLGRDLSMAGYGLKVPDLELQRWLTWAPLTANPQITQGGGATPDRLRVAGAFEVASTLAVAASNGNTFIIISGADSAKFDLARRKVIYIGECELARIVGISGNVLNISTDPASIKGLRFRHALGAPVELVKVYEYTVDNSMPSSGIPTCLKRTDLGSESAFWFQDVVAAGIDDLQVARNGNMASVFLRARSLMPEAHHTDSEVGDHFRRLSASNSVCMRNR